MNVSTTFQALRTNLTQLATWTEDQLTQLATQIGTGWNMEHDSEGGHTSVTCSGTLTCQQLKLRGFTTFDFSGGATTSAPLTVQVGVSFVSLIAPGSGPLDVYGINQVGQQYGDILWLRRDPKSPSNVVFHDRAGFAVTPRNTEVYLDSEITASYPLFRLTGAAWVPLVYSPGSGTNNLDAWVLLQVHSL